MLIITECTWVSETFPLMIGKCINLQPPGWVFYVPISETWGFTTAVPEVINEWKRAALLFPRGQVTPEPPLLPPVKMACWTSTPCIPFLTRAHLSVKSAKMIIFRYASERPLFELPITHFMASKNTWELFQSRFKFRCWEGVFPLGLKSNI